jgi:predicted permease
MNILRHLFMGFKALFANERRSKELDEELATFLEAATAEKMRAGQSYQEALRNARVEMGSREAVKEKVRSAGWEAIAEGLWQDLRFSIRMLAKSPGFTSVAVVSLALGIGANTAIFTLMNELILKSLPVRAPQDLVSFGAAEGGGQVDGITPGPLDLFPYDFYQSVNGRSPLLDGVCANASFNTRVSVRLSRATSESAALGLSHLVSANFFQVLRATPLMGRTLGPADADAPDRQAVAVVSYGFWEDSLAGDPAAIGRRVSINGTSFVIVGVMPANFYGVGLGEEVPDFWLPLTMQTEVMLQPSLLGPHGLYWLHFMGRRRPGVPLGQIQAWITSRLQEYMIDRESATLTGTRRHEIRGIFVAVLPGARGVSDLRARFASPLAVLMGIVILVLLIACANLANFLLARAATREREFSTRLALGCSPGRIVRCLLAEALIMALAGGSLGLVLSFFATRGLIKFVMADATGHTALSAVPDARVLLFTLGISLLTGLLFGLAPAVRVQRLSMTPAEQASVRSAMSSGRRGRSVSRLLIAAQIMLSLMLLASAGLFARTLNNLENRDFGFSRRKVLLVAFNAKFAGYKPEQVNALYERMLDGVAAVPGVRSVSISGSAPIRGGSWNSPIYFKAVADQKKDQSTLLDRVGPHYFETIGITLLRGRTMGPQDTASAIKVAVVNQALADYFFPKGDAIGQSFTVADPSVKGQFQIVGVVRNAKYVSPRERQQRMAYLPVMQLTGDDAYAYYLEMRTAGEPLTVLTGVRHALASIDPNLPIVQVKTMEEQTDLQMANEILVSRLSSFFSLLALLLACIGLYGVMTYSVRRRSAEIGIRMTLGAQTGSVLRMILNESLVLLAAGIALGLPATVAIARLFQSQLFGLTPFDPATLIFSVVIISAVVLTSAYFPARRAARVDPIVTLRYQ